MIETGSFFRGCAEGIGTLRVRVAFQRITRSVPAGCVATRENIWEKPRSRKVTPTKHGPSSEKICPWNLRMRTPDYVRAHKHSMRNRDELLLSERCGCFYCGAMFPPTEVKDWTDEREDIGQTALCPRCGIDAVIGSKSGYPITIDFLGLMRAHWFQKH